MKSFCLIIKFLIVFGANSFLATGDPAEGQTSLSFRTTDLIAEIDRLRGARVPLSDEIDWAAKDIREDLVGQFLCDSFSKENGFERHLLSHERDIWKERFASLSSLDSYREVIQRLREDLDYDANGKLKANSPKNTLYKKIMRLEDIAISSLVFHVGKDGLTVSIDQDSVQSKLSGFKNTDVSGELKVSVDNDVRPVDKLFWYAYLQVFLGVGKSLRVISPIQYNSTQNFDIFAVIRGLQMGATKNMPTQAFDLSNFNSDSFEHTVSGLRMGDITRLMWMDAYWKGKLFFVNSQMTPLGKLIFNSLSQRSATNEGVINLVPEELKEIIFTIERTMLHTTPYRERDFFSHVSKIVSRDLDFVDLNPDYVDIRSFVFKFNHFVYRPKIADINEISFSVLELKEFQKAMVGLILPALHHLLQVRRYQRANTDQYSRQPMNEGVLPDEVLFRLNDSFRFFLKSFKPETKEGRAQKAELRRIYRDYQQLEWDLYEAGLIRGDGFLDRAGFIPALSRFYMALPPTMRTIRNSVSCLVFFTRVGTNDGKRQ